MRQLEIERQALKKDAAAGGESAERLKKLEKEMADLKEESKGMRAHWQKEKEIITAQRKVKEELEALKAEEQKAERTGDLGRASEIRYGQFPTLQKLMELSPWTSMRVRRSEP